MTLHLPSNPIVAFTLAACFLLAWDPPKSFAEIREWQAVDIADKAMDRHGVHVPPWASKGGKDLEGRHRARASCEERLRVAPKARSEAIEARIGVIEQAIKGKDVWLVVYRYPEHSAQ